jgi:hypothetical protein
VVVAAQDDLHAEVVERIPERRHLIFASMDRAGAETGIVDGHERARSRMRGEQLLAHSR